VSNVLVTENNVVTEIDEENICVVSVGIQGPTGGSGGGGGGGVQQVFVQDTEPVVDAGTVFLWVQTGLGDGTDFTMYFGTGL
jgi:hypothetical protein